MSVTPGLGKQRLRKVAVVPTMNVRNKHAVIIVTTCNDIMLNKGRIALKRVEDAKLMTFDDYVNLRYLIGISA